MMDVLYCVLNDSPEALNMMQEEHIRVIISLLEKFGRDPKVGLGKFRMLNLSMTSSGEGCDLREKEPVPLMPLLGHLAFNSAVLSHFATNLEQLEMSAFK